MNNRQITVPLVTRSGLHVGAGYGDATTDALVRRDARGRPVIPGTSLAGALRAMATRLAPRLDLPSGRRLCKALAGDDGRPCGCVVCRLFGDVNPGDEAGPRGEEEVRAAAGRLWVYDAYPSGDPPGSIRDGVGIARDSRAAYREGQVKFDQEVLPPGTRFELRLELQAPAAGEDEAVEERLLAAVLAEWAAGRGAVGGRVSRGLGALEIAPADETPEGAKAESTITYRRFDLRDPHVLLAYLAEDDPWPQATEDVGWLSRRLQEVAALPPPDNRAEFARGWLQLTAEIAATGPLLVNNPLVAAEAGLDHAPQRGDGRGGRPFLPGAGLKGALRSQAERIARTLATQAARSTEDFLRRCPACDPLVGERDGPQASCDALLQGVVETTAEVADEHLCLACRLFGSARRGSRLRVEDAPLLGDPIYKVQDFLAIDRFTGGGADAFKFDAALLWRPHFRVRLFLENPQQWELGWLLLALRDVHEGLAPLGFGAAKGFGQVRAVDWSVEIGCLHPADAQELGLPAQETAANGLYRVWRVGTADAAAWRAVAMRWIEEFNSQVRGLARDVSEHPSHLPALKADTYFGQRAAELYPVEEERDA